MTNIETPSEVRVTDHRSLLALSWQDGTRFSLDAETLRNHCRCSQCQAQELRKASPPLRSGILITAVEPVGTYGVNISFSDGHARGIFPWSYLHGLDAA